MLKTRLLHPEILQALGEAGHGAQVVPGRRFGTCVAGKRVPATLVNGAADESGTGLRGKKSSACQEKDRQMQ